MNPGNYKVVHRPAVNRFEVDLQGEPAVLVYAIRSGLFLLMHTEVPPAFEGQGIAAMMAREALEYARAEGFKVRSYCSYTTRFIERHPEYQDLLDQ